MSVIGPPTFKLYKSDTGTLIDLFGNIGIWYSNNISFVTDLLNENIFIPDQIEITNVFPNPFNPITQIEFSIPDNMNIQINILDIQGRNIKSILNDEYSRGNHRIEINANDLSSGVYFIELIGNSSTDFSKIILLK